MKIEPLESIVQLKIDEAKAGVLDTSTRNSAVEFAEVIAVGQLPMGLKVGDKVFVKSWGIDIINHNGEKYYFVNTTNKSIVAKVSGVR